MNLPLFRQLGRVLGSLQKRFARRHADQQAQELADEEVEIEARSLGLKQSLPGVEVAFEVMRDKLDQQLSQVDGLDTKAGFIFASASLLTGVLVAWHKPSPHSWIGFTYLPLIALGIYGGVLGLSGAAYQLSVFHTPPGTRVLRDTIVTLEPNTARYIILREIARQYD